MNLRLEYGVFRSHRSLPPEATACRQTRGWAGIERARNSKARGVRFCRYLLLIVLCLVVTAAHADESLHSFSIPASTASEGLAMFAEQSRTPLIYLNESVRDKHTNRVAGSYSISRALDILLRGTGIAGSINERGVLTVTVAESGNESGGKMNATPESRNDKASPFAAILAALAAILSVDAGADQADEEKAAPTRLEEIRVTAQKREERLIDVPISILAMTAEELQLRKITSLDDLSLAVPGLHVERGFFRHIQMRGVSNLQGRSSTISMYLDEASVTSGPFTQLDLRTYDLERVEVLRGPQGTLYGEGSLGGTIRFITKDPILDRFAFNADVAALFTQDGAPGQRIEGMLNVPLIDDELGLRMAGTFENLGGWMDQPAADQKNFNDQNLVNVRIKGLWQPVPQFTVNAMAVIHRNDAPPYLGEDGDGNYTQTFNLTTTPSGEDEYDLYNLTLTYDFPAVRVLSTAAYLEQDRELENFGRVEPTAGEPEFLVYFPFQRDTNDVLSSELRLTSIGSGPGQWTVGGFYRRHRRDVVSSFLFALPAPPGTPLPDPFTFGSSNVSESWAVFGDTSYRLTDRLTLGIGLRYFEDDQKNRISGQTATFDSLSPRGYAQYKVTDQVNIYASAAKGFRSGGINGIGFPDFDPEILWTYELGTKMSLLGGRLSADVAIFYSDFTDYIIFGSTRDVPPLNIQSNAGDATIKGVEWALTWRPTDQWSLGVNGNYVDSEFVEINATSTSHAVGDPLDFSPEYTYTLSAQRDFAWNGRPGFVRLDYNERDRMATRNRSIGPFYFGESDIISMLNFHMSLQWNDNLSLGLFAQNLLDDRGFTGPSHFTGLAARSRPRTFGVEFGVTFD